MSLSPLPTRQFHIQDQETWTAKMAVIDAWGLDSRSLSDLDLNRKGGVIPSPGKHAAFEGREDVLDRFHAGFGWQDDDAGTRRWIPQGLTGRRRQPRWRRWRQLACRELAQRGR